MLSSQTDRNHDIQDFHVGDRVVCTDNDWHVKVGTTGTVVLRIDGTRTGICWDEYINGHDCKGACEKGYGSYAWNWNLDYGDIAVQPDDPDVLLSIL